MCNNCRPDRNCSMEGVEIGRMDPVIERLVSYAERNGYLSAENRYTQRELAVAEDTVAREKDAHNHLQYKYNNVNADREEMEQTIKKLERKIPKKKTNKKGRK